MLNKQNNTPVLSSSISILNALNQADTVTEKARLLAKDILSHQLNNEDEFLRRVRDIYPEISFYSGTVEGSPDGTTRVSGSVQEQRRTELSFLCLYWLLRGDYDKLTQNQPQGAKLSRETFAKLQNTVNSLLHNEEAIDAMFSTMAIHDLGKILWFQEKVKKESKLSSVDHDEILLFALKHCPGIMPSYTRIAKKYQDLIRNAWNMRFNLGQFVQGENLPANLTNCLAAARDDSHVIDYFFLHEILDLGGVTGHLSLNGSQTLNEDNIFAYHAAWETVINQRDQNEVAVYDTYMDKRGQKLGLDVKDPEQRAVIRLCCNARLFNKDDGKLLLEAFRSLPGSCQAILKKELNVTGLGNEKGILLYYAPQTLVNLLKGKTGQQKMQALQAGFELLARLYMDARIYHKGKTEKGVYTLWIAPVSDMAAKDPDMLKRKDIEIDLAAGRVTKVADHSSIHTDKFASLNLNQLPGNRIVIIGMGGGSDGIQAKLVAELAQQAGKDVVGSVSVRTKYTQFDSRSVPKGTKREIRSPAATLGNDIYLLAQNSQGVNFDRFLENAVADGKTTYMVLDPVQDSIPEAKNEENLSQQLQTLLQQLKADTVIALDTGGDGLYQEDAASDVSASKSTPDQDLRVLKALNKLDIKHMLTMEVATGVDSPKNAEAVLQTAKASYFCPSAAEKDYLLRRYQELGMDADHAREDRFGKTAFAWQQAMINKEAKGFTFLPVPDSCVLDPKSPWDPVVFLDDAMQGIFTMDLRNHVAAISSQSDDLETAALCYLQSADGRDVHGFYAILGLAFSLFIIEQMYKRPDTIPVGVFAFILIFPHTFPNTVNAINYAQTKVACEAFLKERVGEEAFQKIKGLGYHGAVGFFPCSILLDKYKAVNKERIKKEIRSILNSCQTPAA